MGVLITSFLQVLFGGVMHLLVNYIMVGDKTPAEKTQKLWAEIQREYDLLDIPRSSRFGSMKLSMFSPKGLNLS